MQTEQVSLDATSSNVYLRCTAALTPLLTSKVIWFQQCNSLYTCNACTL